MKISKYIIAASVSLMVLSSCGKEYLETTPTTGLATANVFQNINYVEMAVQGLVYNMQQQMGSFGAYTAYYCGEQYIISTFENYTSQTFSYPIFSSGWAVVMNGNYFSNPQTLYSQYPWAYYYKIIGNANAIIANVDACPDGTEAQKNYYKAQALTFRAWCYARLLAFYSVRWKDSQEGAADGVVLRLDTSTGSCPISTEKEVYDQIYADVDEAVKLFDAAAENGVVRPSGKVWLPDANTAQAVKALAAITREDWTVARDAAVAAQAGKTLMTPAEYKAGFCNPTDEWLFGSAAEDFSTDNGWYFTFGTQFAANGYYNTYTNYGCGGCDMDLLKSIPDNDIRKGLFITPDKFSAYDWSDPEVMNQTYGFVQNDTLCAEIRKYIDDNTPGGEVGQVGYAYGQGYYFLGGQLKFWVKNMPGYGSVPYIRASEMLLIEAEACSHISGGESQAQAALVKLNAETGRQPGYTCSKTGNDLFEEIVKYRKLELWGEGRDWSDHKRWKRAITRTSFADGGNHHAATAVTILPDDPQKSNWCWAIPEIETLYNKDLQD